MEGIAESGVAIEVSTAGLRKPVGEIYPAPAFLEMCLEAGCPIALSSDAHVPDAPRLRLRARRSSCSTTSASTSSRVFERPRAAAGADRVSAAHRHRLGLAPPRGGPAADARRRRDRRSERGLAGHSDADVLTHAVIDALLGAAGLGDIGQHFPDTDERWRDADSLELLRDVVARLAERGCAVVHVDATVVLRAPEARRRTATRCARALADALGVGAGARERQGHDRRGHGVRRARRGRRGAGRRDRSCPVRTADARRRAAGPLRGALRGRGPARARRPAHDALPDPAGRRGRRARARARDAGRRGRPGRHPARRAAAAALPGGVLQLAARDARQRAPDLSRWRSASWSATTAGVAVVGPR